MQSDDNRELQEDVQAVTTTPKKKKQPISQVNAAKKDSDHHNMSNATVDEVSNNRNIVTESGALASVLDSSLPDIQLSDNVPNNTEPLSEDIDMFDESQDYSDGVEVQFEDTLDSISTNVICEEQQSIPGSETGDSLSKETRHETIQIQTPPVAKTLDTVTVSIYCFPHFFFVYYTFNP